VSRFWHRLSLLVVLVGGCGDDVLEYEGTAGQATPARLDAWVPAVPVRVDEVAALDFLVDTGAPVSMLDVDSFPDRDDGAHQVELQGFGLRFPAYPVLAFDVFAYEQAPEVALHGIIGGDLLRHFAVTIDYQVPRVWLEDAPDGLPAGVATGAVEAGVAIAAEVRGGGAALIPGACPGGCGTVELDATRFLVQVRIEDDATPRWMLVDTGATAVVLDAAVADALPDPDRPRLQGVTVGTAMGQVTAYYTRLARLEVGAAAEDHSVSALVLPDPGLFQGLSAEVGVEVVGLLGASFLRRFLTTIDYPAATLSLAPYRTTGHIDPDEFVRVGFTMTQRDAAWQVQDVYPGTDAAAQGLISGDTIAELDGTAIGGAPASRVAELLSGFGLGDQVPVGVNRDGALEVVLVTVEDLLPAYP
jgi:predicted aspartyl protease